MFRLTSFIWTPTSFPLKKLIVTLVVALATTNIFADASLDESLGTIERRFILNTTKNGIPLEQALDSKARACLGLAREGRLLRQHIAEAHERLLTHSRDDFAIFEWRKARGLRAQTPDGRFLERPQEYLEGVTINYKKDLQRLDARRLNHERNAIFCGITPESFALEHPDVSRYDRLIREGKLSELPEHFFEIFPERLPSGVSVENIK